ncbi:hypothetical protein GQ457_06G016720 [Hibiscus cannabinus]
MSTVVNNDAWKPFRIYRVRIGVSHLFVADIIILFAEASVDQMTNICKILDCFCAMSGLKKVKDKLSGWSVKSLSLVGRVVLAKVVFSVIPSYSMQTAFLPRGVCNVIERLIRNFIWGHTIDKNGIHLLNWETICQLLNEDGLGLTDVYGQASWDIGDGVRVNFWMDSWLGGFGSLRNHLNFPSANRSFMIRSAYGTRTGTSFGPFEPICRGIARYKELPHILYFLWLACHDKLHTNKEPVRRHMASDSSCLVFGDSNEDIYHVLCRCPGLVSIWRRVVRSDRLDEFFRLQFKDWILTNIMNADQIVFNGLNWEILFGLLVWNIWKLRNMTTFEPNIAYPKSVLEMSLRMMKNLGANGFVEPWQENRRIGCCRHRVGTSSMPMVLVVVCLKLRPTVGSCVEIRPFTTNWDLHSLGGRALEYSEGLMAMWSLGITRLVVEFDCMLAIRTIRSYKSGASLFGLLSQIVHLLSRSWEVHFEHVSRVQNKVVDGMARKATFED